MPTSTDRTLTWRSCSTRAGGSSTNRTFFSLGITPTARMTEHRSPAMQSPAAQPQGVPNDDQVRSAHGKGRQNRAQKTQRRQRNAAGIVEESPKEVLLN